MTSTSDIAQRYFGALGAQERVAPDGIQGFASNHAGRGSQRAAEAPV